MKVLSSATVRKTLELLEWQTSSRKFATPDPRDGLFTLNHFDPKTSLKGRFHCLNACPIGLFL